MTETKKKKERTCPHCGSTHLEFEGDTLVCTECGTVIENSVISSEQERFYSYEDAVKKGRHSFTSQVVPKTRTERRNLHLAISLIDDLINKLHLPHFIREDAIKRYKQLMREKKLRKDIVPAIAAALVYLVCRRSRIPLPLQRVAEESGVPKSDIVKNYSEILELLRLEVPPPSIEGLAMFLAKKADLQPKTVALSRKIASKLKNEISQIGKDPNGVAAAAVYTAAKRKGEDVTQEEIANIASITSITLRNQLEGLRY
ncbi:MAG: transcription initiation factor IIB family protein [Candidatus Korarchaeota archaeon]|nr:transcription initiation factor IIB family protein [Candidatus Korarchaeota archaeon]NIU82654.1 hypothetical protein [Candidatus Thorarchaeota archaeon]NIW13135.1 hypothetical protein [Candidatus Thorarchaeota archaeon]NIW51294.1 hypothetical protein [Candidatus Korarchaeota archaeon]